MGAKDVTEVMAVIDAANAAKADAGLRQSRNPPTEAQRETALRGHRRFVDRDGPGAWVAESGGRVVGVTESIRRGSFWGLSMLFVHPGFQGKGVGRRLLDAALAYGAGASQRMIEGSPDPRALRRYFLTGLAMYPTAEFGGTPDRRAIPATLPGREGEEADLDLVASVEESLGRTRAEDAAFSLRDGRFRLAVVDSGPGRGWALWRPDRLVMLGATDEETAAALLWRHLASCEGKTQVFSLTASQQWAFAVAHAARLSVRVDGALFVGGIDVPGPWIPSGWYF